jgi:hypothetical protein
MGNPNETQNRIPSLNDQIHRAGNLGTLYSTGAIVKRERRNELTQKADRTESQLQRYIDEQRRTIELIRQQAQEEAGEEEMWESMTDISIGILERFGYEDPLIQGLGKLSLSVLNRLHKEKQIDIGARTFLDRIAQTDFGFFYHPTKKLNVISSKDQKTRFAIGPGGTVGLVVFDQTDFELETPADYLFGSSMDYTIQRRMFSRQAVEGSEVPYYSAGAVIGNPDITFDLTTMVPEDFQATLGDQYNRINSAVQQLVVESY